MQCLIYVYNNIEYLLPNQFSEIADNSLPSYNKQRDSFEFLNHVHNVMLFVHIPRGESVYAYKCQSIVYINALYTDTTYI